MKNGNELICKQTKASYYFPRGVERAEGNTSDILGGTEMETVLDMMTEVGREVEGRESKTNKISRLEER